MTDEHAALIREAVGDKALANNHAEADAFTSRTSASYAAGRTTWRRPQLNTPTDGPR